MAFVEDGVGDQSVETGATGFPEHLKIIRCTLYQKGGLRFADVWHSGPFCLSIRMEFGWKGLKQCAYSYIYQIVQYKGLKTNKISGRKKGYVSYMAEARLSCGAAPHWHRRIRSPS